MFGGHLPELAILLVIALVIFGPKRLPEIGGAMGRGIREFKKGTSEDTDKSTSEKPARLSTAPHDEDVSATSSARERDVS